MAEATQYMFNHKELVTLLIKQQQLHEGQWQLLVNFQVQVGNIGPSPNEVTPGLMALLTNVGIQRSAEKNNQTVDAAEVNPAE